MGMFSKFRLVALACMLLFTIGLVSACKVPSSGTNGQSTVPPTVTPSAQDVVEVVYFHRAQRCSGCIHAQDMTEYTLNTYFAEELENGEIVFTALNLQDASNSDMVQKFGAYTSSLFLNDVSNGVDDIEELTDVWFVLWDDEEFVDIVKTAIEECLAD